MKNHKQKIKNSDLILFFNRLEMYISSGFPLDKALSIITSSSNKKLKVHLDLVASDLLLGISLSNSLSNRFVLSRSTTNLISNGEASGKLNQSLAFCADLLEKESNIKKKCLGALTYPLVIGTFSLGLTLFLIQGVMKQIIPLLKSLKISLPLGTKILIYLSTFLTKNYLILILIVFLGLILSKILVSKIPKIRYLFHLFLIRFPILGATITNYQIFIITKSIGSLLKSGLSVDKAYENVISSRDLIPIREHFYSFHKDITEGLSVKVPFSRFRLPLYIPALIEAGELSGSLADSFTRCSELIEKDIDNFIKKFTVLIEPAMMIVVGGIVGFVAVSIMLPIYSISNTLQHT